ncbi:uncharacterized protein LOC123616494 isoform X2 [Camelus bactrianus]|uniref:Uncharacterized protein LOC123616494 isoform X2 n=1 Tax=Camelus bactrianus TaxID=9837 RepID=A0AC58NM42_CAMBA
MGQSSDRDKELSMTAADGFFWEHCFIGSVLIWALITKPQPGKNSLKGSSLFCLGRVVLRVAGATLSAVEEGPEGQLRPVVGEARGTRPLECSEASLRPGGSCGGPGRVPPLPRVEGTGLGPGHGYRAVDQAPRAPREAGTGSQDSKHETQAHMSKHVDKWAQIHRPEGHPASAGHMDTM